jgi:predicted GIY-YIG superfamily endonuclease
MTFWAYMLHCRGGYFYTGHTDNLENRIAQHEVGAIDGFTRDHLPVKLAWSAEFSTRIEALEAERRIKGWSRAKKMSLTRGDWEQISLLAKNRQVKDSPLRLAACSSRSGQASTSSGRTVIIKATPSTNSTLAEPVKALSLISHPDTLPISVEAIDTTLQHENDRWVLTFKIQGALPLIPPPASPSRTDNLWKTTCFELFVRGQGEDYVEFNFSPSGQWAAYHFEHYRSAMTQLPITSPHIEPIEDGVRITLDYALPATGTIHAALSAVIEETDGTKSYWALAHGPGAPDFHHPDCFALTLPAFGAA